MYQIEGVIRGTAPILFNHWTEAAERGVREGTTGGKFTDEQRLTEALAKCYYREGLGLILPPNNLKKCLVEGAMKAGLKEGRRGLAGFLEASVFVAGDLCFGRDAPDDIHETMGRRPPRTGGACLIKRPFLKEGWRLPFRFAVVDPRRNADQIRTALEEAGMLVGLCDWRPEYGRFIVTEWSVSDSRSSAK